MKAILPILFGASAALLAPLGPIASAAPESTPVAAAFTVDCDAPASPNEVLICTDPDLRVREQALTRLAAGRGGADLDWLRDAREGCETIACLRTSYDAGLRELSEGAAI